MAEELGISGTGGTGGTPGGGFWCYYNNRTQRELVDTCEDCYARHGYIGVQCVGTGGGGTSTCGARQALYRLPVDTAFEAMLLDQIPESMVDELVARSPGDAASSFGPTSEEGAVAVTPDGRRAIAEALARSLTEVAPTYRTALEVRNRVLAKTDRGKEFIRRYYENVDEMNAVMARDPGLASDFRATSIRLQPFGAGLVQAAAGKPATTQYTHDVHQDVGKLLQRFHDNSDDPDFRSAVHAAKTELDGYVGLSADKAFKKLRDASPKS